MALRYDQFSRALGLKYQYLGLLGQINFFNPRVF
jgi:hypothetical protein